MCTNSSILARVFPNRFFLAEFPCLLPSNVLRFAWSSQRNRCGNNYGWSIFEGSRCQNNVDNKVPCSEWRDPEARAPFKFPYFEYCHPGYRSTDAVNTGDNDLCGDRQITGHAVIGARFCQRSLSGVFWLQ